MFPFLAQSITWETATNHRIQPMSRVWRKREGCTCWTLISSSWPVWMASMDSIVATVEKAQQAPQLSWFLTSVTTCFSLLHSQVIKVNPKCRKAKQLTSRLWPGPPIFASSTLPSWPAKTWNGNTQGDWASAWVRQKTPPAKSLQTWWSRSWRRSGRPTAPCWGCPESAWSDGRIRPSPERSCGCGGLRKTGTGLRRRPLCGWWQGRRGSTARTGPTSRARLSTELEPYLISRRVRMYFKWLHSFFRII